MMRNEILHECEARPSGSCARLDSAGERKLQSAPMRRKARISAVSCGFLAAALWGAADGPRAGSPAAPRREFTNSLGMTLVLVRPGAFTMGSEKAEILRVNRMAPRWKSPAALDEAPAHRVRITRPFYISRCEVTNAQFRRFKPDHRSRAFLGHSLDGDAQPAVFVSWEDAQAFCRWLSKREGRAYALPTEAEWEFACRGGTTTSFYWGDRFDPKKLNFSDRRGYHAWRGRMGDDGHAASAAVGSYPPNPLGLRDMLGNVWEWCADWYDVNHYGRSPAADPKGPKRGLLRVCRGGGWDAFPCDCRCAKRGKWFPDEGHMAIGFRVVMRPAAR